MVCEKLKAGVDYSCSTPKKKYYQQVVLVNRRDINNKKITTSYTDNTDGTFKFRNRVLFDLLPNTTGYRFTLNENTDTLKGFFDKSVVNGVAQYSHSVNIAIQSVNELQKVILKQLDAGDCIAAIQYTNGVVEIYGFEFGLDTSGYTYSPQDSDGGSVLTLRSLPDALEDEPPFVWGGTIEEFNNNFVDVVFDINGDFNDDFNNDFNNQ